MTSSTETTLRFSGDWPAMPVIGLAAALALLMLLLYRREAANTASSLSWVPKVCRALAVFVLVLALAGPVLRHETTQKQLGRVVVTVDGSESMRLTDASEGKTRWQRAEELLLHHENGLLTKLIKTADVELIALRGALPQRLWWHRNGGKDVSGEIPHELGLQPNASRTDLDNCLRRTLGTATAGSALVVLTDGQHNAEGSPEEMSRAMKSSAVPIFTVGYGLEASPPDLSVLDVIASESVFEEEVMRGRIVVQDRMPAGLPALVKIEGAAGLMLWQQSYETTGKGERSFEFNFPVKILPPIAGEEDKQLRLCNVTTAITGEKSTTEKTRANNSAELAFQVLDKRRKMLILDGGARWETRYVHNHFDRDRTWDVTLAFDDYKSDADNALRKAFPKTLDDLLTFDLVILGDVLPQRLGPDAEKWLSEFVNQRGGGLILIDGARHALRTWSSDLMPVSWAATNAIKNEPRSWRLESEANRFNAVRLSESTSGNAELWQALPPANWCAGVTSLPGSITLASLVDKAGTAHPAFVFRNVGAGAVLYVGSDELWRWRFQMADLYHQRIWVQLASWIAAPPFHAEAGPLALGVDRLRYEPGQQAELRVRVKDTNGKLNKDAQPRAFLIQDGKDIATMEMTPDESHVGVYRALTPPLKSGQWQVSVAESPNSPRSSLKLSLRVSEGGAQELSQLTMNRVLLESMARNSGGRFLREEDGQSLLRLLETIDRKQVSIDETILWSSWWWLGITIALLTIEWLMRRKLRLV